MSDATFQLAASIAKILFVWGVVLAALLPNLVWAERRVAGMIQDRPGPNRVGPFGFFQIQQISQRQSLDRARQLIAAKNDSEAMTELQRVLAIEATNAEAHYLRGVILQRRGEADAAISAFQSAVSWNPRLIDAHVALGRLYLSRGDRAQALAHSKQALEIDPQNRDAVALRQQIETGR